MINIYSLLIIQCYTKLYLNLFKNSEIFSSECSVYKKQKTEKETGILPLPDYYIFTYLFYYKLSLSTSMFGF